MQRAFIIVSLFCLLAPGVLAAPPKLDYLFPAGAQRGQKTTITASGSFSTWPPLVWADRPGVSAAADKDKGKLNVEVADSAVPGVYWLRLTDGEGGSQMRPFIVGTLPEVSESEPNDAPDKPQAVNARVVVNGKLGRSADVDAYRVDLKQGQTLVASVQANSVLGSPMDTVLQICELIPRPHASRQLEPFVAAQNHDTMGLDPQIAFIAPRDGAYLVRLFAFPATPDSSIRFAGGDNFVYRLTLTTGGFIDHVLPLALPAGEAAIELGGWNLAVGTATSPAIADSLRDDLSPSDSPLAWVWHTDAAGAFPLARTDHPSLVAGDIQARSASEGSSGHQPQTVEPPVTISGRLEAPGDVHAFAFRAGKDEKMRIRVAARSLGFQTDPVVEVHSESGEMLAEADDSGRDDRDPQLEFTAPADGTYRVLVRDLAGRGDLRMVYRLTIEPVQPNFSLAVAADSFLLTAGKPLEIPINVTVSGGLREPIAFHVLGLPAGVVAEPTTFTPTSDTPQPTPGSGRRSRRDSQPAPAAPNVKLVLKADASVIQPGGTPIRIEGRTPSSSPLVRSARFPLNLPLTGSHHAVWLTTKKP